MNKMKKTQKKEKIHPWGGIRKVGLYTSIVWLVSRHIFTTQQNEYVQQTPVEWAQLVPISLLVGKNSSH